MGDRELVPQMDLTQLGSIGEFVSGVAVVVSLLYLSVQIRQNTKTVRASTFADTTNGWQDYLLAQSVEDLDLLVKLSSRPDELTHSEFLRAYYLARVLFRRVENDYFQVRVGGFDEATLDAYMASFRDDMLSVPGMRAMWEIQRNYFAADYVSFLTKHAERAIGDEHHRRREFREAMSKLTAATDRP